MEEIDDDDDFGDLYADLINVDTDKCIINGEHFVPLGDVGKVSGLDNGNDIEDDLNVVLNLDDRGNVVFVGGTSARDDHFVLNHASKIEQGSPGTAVDRGNTSQGSAVAKGNIAATASDFFKKNEWNEDKYACSSQVAQRHLASKTSRCKLPMKRNRTVLNENIDTFYQRPWRNFAVDATDFFHFGFNEQSWKNYCQAVACHAKLEYEEMSKEDMDVTSFKQPIGRAIEVGGSIGERQSFMDVKHPLLLDPDVVIQITGHDSHDEYSSSDQKRVDHNSSSSCDATQNDQNEDTCSTGSANGEKLCTKSLEGSIRNPNSRSAATGRCPQQGASFNSTSMNSDKPGGGHLSDSEKKHIKKLQFSEGNAVTMEAHNNKKKVVCRDLVTTDLSVKETDFSYDIQVQLSPSISCLGSHSESSEDDVCIEPRRIKRSLRMPSLNSVAELQKPVKPEYIMNSASIHVRDKPSYCKESARRNRSQLRERETVCHRRPHAEGNGSSESPLPGEELRVSKYHSHVIQTGQHRRQYSFGYYPKNDTSFYRDKYHNDRCVDAHLRNAKSKSSYVQHHPRFKNDAGPCIERTCSERDYLDQRFIRGKDWDCRERGKSIKDTDSPVHRESVKLDSKYSFYSDEEKDTRWSGIRDGHYFEKRNEGRDPWLEHGRADDIKDTDSRTHRELSARDSKYSLYIAEGVNKRQSGSSNGHYFEKINEGSDPWFNHRHFMQRKNQRDIPFTDQQYDCIDERGSRCARSTMENFGGRDKFGRWDRFDYCPTSDTDYSQFIGIKSNCWRDMDLHSFSRSHRESPITDGRRWPGTVSPGGDGNGRFWEGTYPEGLQNGRWRSENEDYDYENSLASVNNQGHSNRIGFYQSKSFHWSEGRLFSRDKDYKHYINDSSLSNGRISRDERVRATDRYAHDRMVIDEEKTDQDQYKMIQKGYECGFLNRRSKPTYSSQHEQKFATCSDSVDLVGGVGKLNERRTKAAKSIMCCDKLKNMKSVKEEVHAKFHEVEWLDKLPVSEQNEGLEPEEGQIVTNAVDIDFVTKDVNESNGNNKIAVEGINEDRILHSLAKMEKRRERFKELITSKNEPNISRKEPHNNTEPCVDPQMETAEVNQQRRARKRRWGSKLVGS